MSNGLKEFLWNLDGSDGCAVSQRRYQLSELVPDDHDSVDEWRSNCLFFLVLQGSSRPDSMSAAEGPTAKFRQLIDNVWVDVVKFLALG